jgi:hypothetical protein
MRVFGTTFLALGAFVTSTSVLLPLGFLAALVGLRGHEAAVDAGLGISAVTEDAEEDEEDDEDVELTDVSSESFVVADDVEENVETVGVHMRQIWDVLHFRGIPLIADTDFIVDCDLRVLMITPGLLMSARLINPGAERDSENARPPVVEKLVTSVKVVRAVREQREDPMMMLVVVGALLPALPGTAAMVIPNKFGLGQVGSQPTFLPHKLLSNLVVNCTAQ